MGAVWGGGRCAGRDSCLTTEREGGLWPRLLLAERAPEGAPKAGPVPPVTLRAGGTTAARLTFRGP